MSAKKSFLIVLLIILVTSICSTAIAATPAEIEQAIDDGITWLVSQQDPTGYWQDSGSTAGPTGLALIKLQERTFELGYDSPFDPCYPYKENVEKGLEYLFSNMSIISTPNQPAGNPDTDGDGNGVYVSTGYPVYETGIVMMAIAASRTPDREVNSPNSPVDGWTYKEVLQDMVDYMAFGQCDSGTGRGGWGYEAINNGEGWADNSCSGFAVSGLGYAESPRYGFNCTIPQFVKDELKIWIDYIQIDGGDDDGGSGYTSPFDGGNILRTGNLIFEMTFAGISLEDPNMQRALDYISRNWDYGWSGDCQTMYCTANGLWYSVINTIAVDGNERDWYADFADNLVDIQQSTGYWYSSYGNILGTEWALLALERPASYVFLEKVDDVNDGECVGPGDEIIYIIEYSYPNEPNLPVYNDVTIIDYLPDEVDFNDASGTYTQPDSNTVVWNIGSLEPGDSGSVTLTVKVKPCVEQGGTITNECEMKSENTTIGIAAESTEICCPTITKEKILPDGNCVSSGDEIIYNICYDANGYGDTNVVITDELPNEVNYVSSDPCGVYNSGNHTVTWGIDFPADAFGCIELVVQVNANAEPLGTITNCSQMSGDCIQDINACEETDVCWWPCCCPIYVDANAAGAGTGCSWEDAFTSLQDALAKAQFCNCEQIWVAAGTYKPDCNSAFPNGSGNRESTFNLISNVAIYGGFPSGGAMWESRDPYDPNNETILSGDLAGNDPIGRPAEWDPNLNDNSYHVVTAIGVNDAAVLDGFTITGGNAVADYYYYAGGGMYSEGGSPTVKNCTFRKNYAGYSGGGMFNYLDSSPNIVNCKFIQNLVGRYDTGTGGGIYNYDNSNPTITGCTFIENEADYGAGISNQESSPIVTNCTFIRNSADFWSGGGIHDGYLSSSIITNCKFIDNSAPQGGGIAGQSTVTNCIFIANRAVGSLYSGGSGGAMFTDSNAVVNNCTFSANSALNCDYGSGTGGGIYSSNETTKIVNCIIYGNTAGDGNEIYGAADVSYSNVKGGWPEPNEGIIDEDPCFVELGHWADANDPNIAGNPNDPNAVWVNGNYRLLRCSPCIDTGDPNYSDPNNTTDLDGFPRFIDGDCNDSNIVDMGAYEFLGSDIDHSGAVNFIDFAEFALQWLESDCAPCFGPDLNCDCSVDFADLEKFARWWLAGID